MSNIIIFTWIFIKILKTLAINRIYYFIIKIRRGLILNVNSILLVTIHLLILNVLWKTRSFLLLLKFLFIFNKFYVFCLNIVQRVYLKFWFFILLLKLCSHMIRTKADLYKIFFTLLITFLLLTILFRSLWSKIELFHFFWNNYSIFYLFSLIFIKLRNIISLRI